jgi:hypothetical protein
MDYKQIKILKERKKNMKEFMKKGISTLPVVNEILFFVLLAHEVIGLAKDWYKTSKSSTENKPEEDPEKK